MGGRPEAIFAPPAVVGVPVIPLCPAEEGVENGDDFVCCAILVSTNEV